MIDFNPLSTHHLSALFFGGTFTIGERQHVGYFKNGNPKMKIIDKAVIIKGVGLPVNQEWATKADGVYATNEKILEEIAANSNIKDAKRMAEILLGTRKLEKQISTYFTSIKDVVYDIDFCIHATIHHTSTNTGRTSAANPNIQNQPRPGTSKALQHYVSRYPGGKIVIVDCKQLEVVAFAYLSGDETLKNHLRNGIDIHKVLAAKLYDIDIENVSSEQRQQVKPCTFLVIYGGGPKKLAKTHNVTIDFAKKFIDSFIEMYPETKNWQDNLVRQIYDDATWIQEKTPKGHWKHISSFTTVTGRELVFKTNDAPDYMVEKGTLTGFNPTDIKNYPVQSFATADFVPFLIGKIFRAALKYRDRFLLINTVHDSIITDIKSEWVSWYKEKFIPDMEKTIVQEFNQHFRLDLDLPVNLEVKSGNNWWECG